MWPVHILTTACTHHEEVTWLQLCLHNQVEAPRKWWSAMNINVTMHAWSIFSYLVLTIIYIYVSIQSKTRLLVNMNVHLWSIRNSLLLFIDIFSFTLINNDSGINYMLFLIKKNRFHYCAITLLVNSCTVPSFGMDAFSGSVCNTEQNVKKNEYPKDIRTFS